MKHSKLLSGLIFSGIIALTSSAIAEDSTYLEELGAKLKAAVKAGEITKEEAIAKYKAAESGEISDTATSIKGFFVGWIIQHIMGEDRKYSAFLNSKGVY